MDDDYLEEPTCDVPGIPKEPIFYGDYSFNTGKLRQFSAADYVIFAATLIISTVIGFYQAWRSSLHMSLDQYLAAGRSMGAIPVGLSLLASFMSAISLMGNPIEIYNYNTLWFWFSFADFFAIAAAAHLYIPVFYQLHVSTSYQYLEMRFNRLVRAIGSTFFVLSMISYLSIVLYVPSVVINAATGLSLWLSIFLVTVVCTVYTALGGMRAVIYTDMFQVGVMLLGVLTLLIGASVKVGGWHNMWESAERTNRLVFFDFRLDPTVRHTVWGIILGGSSTMLSLYGVNQVQVHRCLTCRTLGEARTAVWMSFPGQALFLYITCCIGLFMAAFYENCDPERANLVRKTPQIVPLFMMDVLGDVTGLPGLYLASQFSATLSTVSSGLHSMSVVLVEDFVKIYVRQNLSEARERLTMQIATLVFGAVCLELTLLVLKIGSFYTAAFSVLGALSAPILGVFSLGMFFPWANAKGAVIGLVSSTLLMALLNAYSTDIVIPAPEKCVSNCNISAFLQNRDYTVEQTGVTPQPLEGDITTNISYIWGSLIGVVQCIVIGIIGSYLTGFQDPKSLDPRLIVPLCDHVVLFNQLPEEIREKLRFGVNHEGKFNTPSSTSLRSVAHKLPFSISGSSVGGQMSMVSALTKHTGVSERPEDRASTRSLSTSLDSHPFMPFQRMKTQTSFSTEV